jgi:hypothetical protein
VPLLQAVLRLPGVDLEKVERAPGEFVCLNNKNSFFFFFFSVGILARLSDPAVV